MLMPDFRHENLRLELALEIERSLRVQGWKDGGFLPVALWHTQPLDNYEN